MRILKERNKMRREFYQQKMKILVLLAADEEKGFISSKEDAEK